MSKRGYEVESELERQVQAPEVLVRPLADDGSFPNSVLPLVLYHGVLEVPERELAAAFEQLFGAHGWGGSWRDGIYPYHHFHSTAHEVLGVYRGSAKVQFGAERGVIEEVRPGDVMIIPAGVAHKNLGGSQDFGVVGAYPEGQDWDMNYGHANERPRVDRNIARVPLPKADPIYGERGPLMEHWVKR